MQTNAHKTKDQRRIDVAKATKAFLASGRKITVAPTRCAGGVSKNKSNLRKR